MLHSKYLTQEGMEIMLKTLYKSGWRYIFRRVYRNEFYVSREKPRYSEDDTLISYPEHQTRLGDILIIFIADALGGHNYIKIADHIDIVDWSKVEVDTPIFVKMSKDGVWRKRYFAYFRNGKVNTWPCGATSWSADRPNDTMSWEYAKLTKDEED
jgi:hypothetical protein